MSAFTGLFAYITPDGLENMKSFQYVGGKYTPIDNLMNHWWAFCASLFPVWISPNMITSFGAVLLIAGTLMSVWQFIYLGYVEGWVFLYCGLAVFIYQTLDAVDGKHARNTQQSSPLGALYDHGLDGFLLCCLGFVSEFATFSELFSGPWMWACLTAPHMSFFVAQWEFLHRRKLEHEGCTEAGILMMVVLLTSGIKGVSFFVDPLPFPAAFGVWTLGHMGLATALLTAVYILVNAGIRVFKECGIVPFYAFVPWTIYNTMCYWLFCGPYREYAVSLRLIVHTGHVVFIEHMILSGLTRIRFRTRRQWWAIPVVVTCLAGVFGEISSPGIVFAAVGVWQLFYVIMMLGKSVNDICDTLNVPFLAPFGPLNSKKED